MERRFTRPVEKTLRKSGWFVGRHIDTTKAEADLRSFGFSVNSVASDFLREFHGLRFIVSRTPLSFNVYQVLGSNHLEADDVPYFNQLIEGGPLCPFGYGLDMFILVSAQREMLLLNDEWLCYKIAPNIELGFELIFEPNEAEVTWIADDKKPPDFRDPPIEITETS